MRILQLSDLHFPDADEELPVSHLTAASYLELLAGALRGISADLVVLSGDLALHQPSEAIYRILSELCSATTVPVLAMPGNHDIGAPLERYFPTPGRLVSRGPEHCSTRELAGRRLLFLDSSAGRVSAAALDWLSGQLAAAGGRQYLFMHHPPLLAGAPFMDDNFPLENHAEVATRLAEVPAGVAVFCGHYHCARDLFRGRLAVHIAPSTLFQIDPGQAEFTILPLPPACRVVELGEGGYRTWCQPLECGPGGDPHPDPP